jgi:hypothetical protein
MITVKIKRDIEWVVLKTQSLAQVMWSTLAVC